MSVLEITHNNALNSSTSKQQYTFSKLRRFTDRSKTEGPDVYYNVPSTRQTKAFTFGKLVHKTSF